MITLEQITAAAANTDPLSDNEIMVLTLLIKQTPDYNQAIGRWPLLDEVLTAEQSANTVKTTALRAVLALLAQVPSVVVESEGSDTEKSFYSTRENWRQLALEALNVLYDLPIILGNQSYVLVQRTIEDLVLPDLYLVDTSPIRPYRVVG